MRLRSGVRLEQIFSVSKTVRSWSLIVFLASLVFGLAIHSVSIVGTRRWVMLLQEHMIQELLMTTTFYSRLKVERRRHG